MATINVATSQNLSAVTYATGDIINVNDGVTLTINSQWATKPYIIQALGTGRIEVSNSSITVPHVQEFYLQNSLNSGGFSTTQNGVLQGRGAWIVVGTSTGTNNQTLFSANNIGGKAIDFPSEIEVETGNGTDVWEVWQAIPLDVPGGTVNTLGFNADNATAGTVAVTAAGVVTGTGTAFTSAMPGTPFKLPGIARDFVISVFTSTTQITIQELDGSTYAGGVIAAGTSYIIRSGSLISPSIVGSGDIGKVLFFNPLTTAVTHGDGTNGTKVPTGARVRVPNIHYNAALQQTTLAAAITSTAAQAITLAAAIGTTSQTGSATAYVGSLLLVNGSTIERISYTTRSGTTVSATGMFRGVAGTTAQASFPIGTLVYWIPASNAVTNNAVFNTNVSGTVDLQICSAGLRMQATFNNFASATIKNFGCALFSITNSSGSYDLDTISSFGQYQISGGGTGVTCSSLIGTGNIRNIHTHGNFALATGGSGIFFVNIQDAQAISNLRCRMFNRTSSVSVNFRSILLQTVTCATPIDGLYFNMVFQATTLTNQDIKNIYFSSTTSSASASTADGAFPLYVQSCVNSTFRGVQIWSGGLATRNLINLDTNSADNVFHNKGYPAIDGGLQLGAITSDTGLNTITAFFSITNPRISTTTASYLRADTTTNSGGLLRMLLIDSITATTTGTGGASKGGVEIDMIAGPHRLFATGTATSIVPNLVDVQPIVVLSNTAKTVGSVYVGPFSAQNAFDMYTFTGGTYLDNLGRIYYPAIGDAVIIKSVFALKGISAFTGTAFDFNYNLGSGTNPIPAGTTLEFRMTNWGTANTGAWTAFTNNASLETARAALSGYSSSVGLDLQFRITGTTAVAARYVIGLKFPATIDAAYSPSVYSTAVGFSGAQSGTLIACYLNATPSNPLLQGSLTLTSDTGSISMPYDYDNIAVAYRLVGRLAGWTFSNLTGTYLKTDITIPITQIQVLDTSSSPLYTSGVTGVVVDHTASTITLSASRTAAQVWSAVQDNLSLLANLTKADPFVTSNGGIFYSSYSLIINGTLSSGNIASNVTLTGALSSGVVITGNVAQATPTDLTGVTINGNLTYNTNTPITVTLTNTTITGTISNSGSATVTISLGNSTIGTVGTRIITRPVTSLTLNGLTAGSQIYIADGSGAQQDYIASSGTSYTLATTGATGTWTWKVVRYGYTAQTGTHLPAVASTSTTVALSADAFITQPTKATVAAYTTLENLDKLYDYAAYYETLNAGIIYSRIITKAGTAASAGAYNVTLNNSGAIWTFTGSALSIYSTTTLAGGTTITGALFTSATVTLTAAQTNTAITANVLQATPTNLSGVIISGSLTYNSASAATVTFTNSVVSGTISNSGGGLVKVVKAGTTPWLTTGSNVTNIASVVVETPGGLALSTYIVKNSVTDLGWVPLNTARSLEINETDTFQIYAIAYGYKAKLVSANALDLTSFKFELLPEPFIDTSLSTVTRNFIASKFSTAPDAYNRIALALNYDLRYYTPDEVMNAVQWYITSEGYLIAAAVLYGGTIDGVEIIQGGILIGSPGFYGKVADSVTTTTDLGILVPIFIDVAPAVYVADPTYTPVRKNSSGIVLQSAPWTKMTADISAVDKTDIRDGLALEASLALKADQSTADLIKSNTSLIPALL